MAKGANEYIRDLREAKSSLLRRAHEAEVRIAQVHAYLERAEKQATRWEDPLPVPEWVGDIRSILEGEQR